MKEINLPTGIAILENYFQKNPEGKIDFIIVLNKGKYFENSKLMFSEYITKSRIIYMYPTKIDEFMEIINTKFTDEIKKKEERERIRKFFGRKQCLDEKKMKEYGDKTFYQFKFDENNKYEPEKNNFVVIIDDWISSGFTSWMVLQKLRLEGYDLDNILLLTGQDNRLYQLRQY